MSQENISKKEKAIRKAGKEIVQNIIQEVTQEIQQEDAREVVAQIFAKADSLQGLQELNEQETKAQRKTRFMMTKFIYKAEFFIDAVFSGTAEMGLLDGEVTEKCVDITNVFKNVMPYLQTFVEFTKYVCIKKLTFNNSNEMFKAFFDYLIEGLSAQDLRFIDIDKEKLTMKFNQFYGCLDELTLEQNRNKFEKFQNALTSFFIKILNEKTFYHFNIDASIQNLAMNCAIVSFPHHFYNETGRRIQMKGWAKEKFCLLVPENEQEALLDLAKQKILAKEPYYNKTSLQNQKETSAEFEVLPYSTAIEMYVSKHFKPEFSIDYILNLTKSSTEDSEAVKYVKEAIRVIWLGRYLENLAIVYMFDQSLIGKDVDVDTIDFWRTVFENTHLEISDYLLIILNNNNSCFNEVKDVFHNKNFRQYLIGNKDLIENLIILASFEPDRFLEFSREIINTNSLGTFTNFVFAEKISNEVFNFKQNCKWFNENDFSTKIKQEILIIPHKRILRPFIDKCKTYEELVVVYSLWQETNFLNQYWLMPKITAEDLTALAEILNDDIENKTKIKLIYSLWPNFAEENWFANNKLELDFVFCFKNISTRQARNIMQKFKNWNVPPNVKERFVKNLKDLNSQDLEIVEDLFLENQNFDFIATIIEAKLKYSEIDMQKFKIKSFKNEILQDKFFNSAEGIRFLYDFKFGNSEVAKKFLLNSLGIMYENLKSYTAIAVSLFGLGAVSSVALVTLKLLWNMQKTNNLDLDEIIEKNNLGTEYDKISSSLDSENNKNETPILEALREFRTQENVK